MITKWLHLNELGGDPWVLPIWRTINQAVHDGRMKKYEQYLSELALYVSFRLNMLPRIVNRINEGCTRLYEKVKSRNPEHDYEEQKEGYALQVDDDLKYNLVIDIDSLLFELNSCCELMGKFLLYVYNQTGKKLDDKDIGKEIKGIIVKSGKDPKWFIELDNHRNFFIHEGTPYIAIDLSREEKYYDLIIMKENLHNSFEDETKYIKLSQLNIIVNGFLKARKIIQEHIIAYINSLA